MTLRSIRDRIWLRIKDLVYCGNRFVKFFVRVASEAVSCVHMP